MATTIWAWRPRIPWPRCGAAPVTPAFASWVWASVPAMPPLEQVAAAIPRLDMGCVGVAMAALINLADVVAKAARRTIPPGQPIVGDTAFTHESGIHVSGLLRDPATYEALDPMIFGRQRRIMLGKHSGSASLRDALRGYNVPRRTCQRC